MNYYSTNPEIRDAVLTLLGSGFTNAAKVNFGVAYSQCRKVSIVTVEVSPSSTIHSLFFIFTRGLVLYDVIRYRNKSFFRINLNGKARTQVDQIHRFLMKWIPKYSPIAVKKIAEELKSDEESERKEQEIQRLKDRIEVEKSINRSLRNQMKVLRSRKS